jgi:carbamoyl-phosphate synthase large subunit
LREASIKIVQSLKIVGECNVQFALNPLGKRGNTRNFTRNDAEASSLDYYVIEVNARLSRSSALASKATGYPLAYVAAKLALGKSLLEVKNKITKVTQSFFEPALDYVVVKLPRWDLEKFKGAEEKIGSAMKSVGEVMAIGRSFEEAVQKAVRMQSGNAEGVTDNGFADKNEVRHFLDIATPKRIFAIAAALRHGIKVAEIHRLTGIDPWFLYRLENIVKAERELVCHCEEARALSGRRSNLSKIDRLLRSGALPRNDMKDYLLNLKRLGFSDKKIAQLSGKTEKEIRTLRLKYNIRPSIFQIDTLAGEVPAKTNYLYLTYHGGHNDVASLGKNAVCVLGSGPYHIGSSVEFDWSAVHAAMALKRHKKQSIIINCNPETVSTDYDMSDRLYFENLSFETVADIYEFEKPLGCIISVGGQRPNNLAKKLSAERFKILGTAAVDIDRAEDRNKFSALLDKLKVDQPLWESFSHMAEAEKFAVRVGYPVLVRPSYVLSGSAMSVCYNQRQLEDFITKAAVLSPEHPVTISNYIEGAKELEFDAVAQDGRTVVYAISEHVENAGVHSGDATIVYPTQRVYASTEQQIIRISHTLAGELKITGPFNIQFLVKDNKPYVIEVNLRASRTFPLLSKALDINLPELAVDSFFGRAPREKIYSYPKAVVVKSPQFSFARLSGADPVLRVEMASTGEVAAFGKTYDEALLKSLLSANTFDFAKRSVLLSLGGQINKAKFLEAAKSISGLAYKIFATDTTAEFLKEQGIVCEKIRKASEPSLKDPGQSRMGNFLDLIQSKQVAFVINLSQRGDHLAQERVERHLTDGFRIRRAAVDNQIPLFTDLHLARAFVQALKNYSVDDLEIKSYREYLQN